MGVAFDLQGVVQVIHRMPNPAFEFTNNRVLGGFATIATYTSSADSQTATAVLVASPSIANPNDTYTAILERHQCGFYPHSRWCAGYGGDFYHGHRFLLFRRWIRVYHHADADRVQQFDFCLL
jgi:hypothetical protein